jgi:hypothetical protein
MDFMLGDSVVERAMTCSYTMDLSSSSYSSSILAMYFIEKKLICRKQDGKSRVPNPDYIK